VIYFLLDIFQEIRIQKTVLHFSDFVTFSNKFKMRTGAGSGTSGNKFGSDKELQDGYVDGVCKVPVARLGL